MLINAILVLVLATEVGFPLWILVLVLLIMEGVPILWYFGIIRKTIFIDRNFIVGFWGILQILVFIFCVIVCAILPCFSSGLTIVFVKVMTASIVGSFMYSRTMILTLLLSQKNKSEVNEF